MLVKILVKAVMHDPKGQDWELWLTFLTFDSGKNFFLSLLFFFFLILEYGWDFSLIKNLIRVLPTFP